MIRSTIGLLGSLLVLAAFGCNPNLFRAETEIRSDGSVRRAIYQPADKTPGAAREEGVWQGSTHAVRISPERWQGTIAELPSAPADKDHDYFAAWGEFASVDDLPQALLFDAPEGIADGTLERDYERTDYVLVVEHRWRETLTDVVTLNDMHQAREELAELVIPLAEKTLQLALGEEYDTQPLVDWMRQEARPLVFDLTDAYFDLRARKIALTEDAEIIAAIEPVLKRHGLTVYDDQGAIRSLDTLVQDYLRETLEQKLRRRDGQPADPQVVLELARWMGIEQIPEGEERSPRLDRAMKQALAERFTSDDAASQTFRPLLARILGVYGSDFGPGHKFHYQQRMPGLLVETSGELVSDDTTLWTFGAAEAYPFGYTMSCRSLEANAALEEKLLGKAVLSDRKRMLAYLNLVRENAPLLAIMQICADGGSLTPLKREYEALQEAGDRGAAEYGKMLELLQSK